MPQSKFKKQECPKKCSGKDRIREACNTEIPPKVKEYLGNKTFYTCGYCSAFWISNLNKQLPLKPLIISHDGFNWLLGDGQFHKLK